MADVELAYLETFIMRLGSAPSLLLALTLLPATAVAQETAPPAASTNAATQAESGRPPQRIRSVTLTGNQPCPKASDPNEVVVCGYETEPYRIPKSLRDDRPIPAQNQSWVNRASTMDEVGRRAGGLPDTCSPVGSGGQTGCAAQTARDYDADKRARAAERRQIP